MCPIVEFYGSWNRVGGKATGVSDPHATSGSLHDQSLSYFQMRQGILHRKRSGQLLRPLRSLVRVHGRLPGDQSEISTTSAGGRRIASAADHGLGTLTFTNSRQVAMISRASSATKMYFHGVVSASGSARKPVSFHRLIRDVIA